jgi:hypothetical protein
MVAQIEEHQPAVVALAVYPSRNLDGLAFVLGAELVASMGTVGVHGILCSLKMTSFFIIKAWENNAFNRLTDYY